MNPRLAPSRDHLFPKSMLGYRPDLIGPKACPIVITCSRCNNDKGDFFLGEWLNRLERTEDPRLEKIRQWMADNAEIVEWAQVLEDDWIERQRAKNRSES
jgi:hypothetical protein